VPRTRVAPNLIMDLSEPSAAGQQAVAALVPEALSVTSADGAVSIY